MNSLDSPPPFQSPRASELRAEPWVARTQDRGGRVALVCQVTVRACWSVPFAEAGPSLTQDHRAGFQSHLLQEGPPVPPVLTGPSPLKSCHVCVSAPYPLLASILLNHVLIIFSLSLCDSELSRAEERTGCLQECSAHGQGNDKVPWILQPWLAGWAVGSQTGAETDCPSPASLPEMVPSLASDPEGNPTSVNHLDHLRSLSLGQF